MCTKRELHPGARAICRMGDQLAHPGKRIRSSGDVEIHSEGDLLIDAKEELSFKTLSTGPVRVPLGSLINAGVQVGGNLLTGSMKFADGMLICYGKSTSTITSNLLLPGGKGIRGHGVPVIMTFHTPFKAGTFPSVKGGARYVTGGSGLRTIIRQDSANRTTEVRLSLTSWDGGSQYQLDYIAWGVWK